MRCLLLSRYSRTGASSRLRHLQYLPHLADAGIAVDVHPFFDDRYLEALYAGRARPWTHVAAAYLRRLAGLLRNRRYDLVWLEKELLPFVPPLAERLLLPADIPYVVDYDDASFHAYDLHPNPLVRAVLGRKIDAVMRRAALVVAGNAYLADRAHRAGARRVEVVPTVVDPDQYPHTPPEPGGVFTVGWVGTPNTVGYLRLVEEAFHALARRLAFRLVVIGAPPPFTGAFETVERPWAEATEGHEIQALDAGIMPLDDGPWERGKCGYKLIQYLACGRPVVASPVGVNTEIVRPGENGFLAATPGEWVEHLHRLGAEPALRRQMGAAGRALVEARYSLAVTGPQMARLLLESAGRA